ncbi:MAG: hypothetical protein OIN89_10065 [Candidatus Methanoperedens sp.]|nr:hypothetical protein [Candidatus Methanoperedens sp.]PKL52985.1 MAG: hypothetical protein CVV36_09545 [Candidatus Methanoperedenaceae archaeon HGW-Methanoperedenaceae-1]
MVLKLPKSGIFVKDRDIVEADFGPMRINRTQVQKFSIRHRGSVRLSSGRYYTEDEFEDRKKKNFKEPLP